MEDLLLSIVAFGLILIPAVIVHEFGHLMGLDDYFQSVLMKKVNLIIYFIEKRNLKILVHIVT